MARSAEELVTWTGWQFGLGFVGTVMLGATLLYTRSAARAAGEAAVAAQKTVATMEKTAKRELRAYVFAIPHLTFNAGKPPVYRVRAHNYGQTPAYQAQIWARAGVSDYPLQGVLPHPNSITMTRTVIPPGDGRQQVEEIFPSELTADEADGIQKGTRGIYIWGEITYRDAFDDDQHTPFRFVYSVANGVGSIELCVDGNDAT